MSAVEQRRIRSFEWEDPIAALESTAGLSGLEVMQAIIAGQDLAAADRQGA